MHFIEVQKAFTAHIKDPENVSHGLCVEERRINVYRELFFNNIVGFIDNAFPVLQSLYSRDHWLALIRQFFSQHESRSPYFAEISKEFVEFLSNEYKSNDDDPPFLAELAHYEWLELDISIRKGDAPDNKARIVSDDTIVTLSPLVSLASYQYPVHQISAEYRPEMSDEPVYVVVYRNINNDVNFSIMNQVTAFLLNTIEQQTLLAQAQSGIRVKELVSILSDALPQISFHEMMSATIEIIQDFAQKSVLAID